MSRELGAASARFAGVRILVIGDVMLDSYLEGSAGRLCREAPVPIVAIGRRRDAPGGAANAAANARALGGEVRVLGVAGRDDAGGRLATQLAAMGIPPEDVVVSEARHTLSKQRVVADGQLLVRVDEGSTGPPDARLAERLLSALPGLHAWADALVVSDYGYGVVGESLVRELARLQAADRRPLVGDAKDVRRLRRLRPDAVKPNYAEACGLLGLAALLGAEARAEQTARQAEGLLDATGAGSVVVTLDGDGSLLLRRGRPPYRTYARPVANDRAAGAGDTVAAVLALALGAGIEPTTAVELASAAAAVAVGKAGTATCSLAELTTLLAGSKQTADPDELAGRIMLERSLGRRIVFTNGCFDILHPGHVDFLTRAKALGDVLVVAVNTDDSVRRLKGEARPVNSLADRLEVLAALSCIDHLVAFEEDNPEELIRRLRPDVVTKGGDYTEATLPEAAVVRAIGAEIRILPFVADRSTTRIIERIGARPSGAAAAPPA